MIVRNVEFEPDDHLWPSTPGGGSLHSVSSDEAGRVFGKPGARIRVRLKQHPVGFHLPPSRGAR